jgi:hypothetical protein
MAKTDVPVAEKMVDFQSRHMSLILKLSDGSLVQFRGGILRVKSAQAEVMKKNPGFGQTFWVLGKAPKLPPMPGTEAAERAALVAQLRPEIEAEVAKPLLARIAAMEKELASYKKEKQ